jgi:hypothetical protein
MVDALAPNADEGRGTLRKVSGSRVQALIREYPNGETHCCEPTVSQVEHIDLQMGTRGTETSHYPEEKRSFPQ